LTLCGLTGIELLVVDPDERGSTWPVVERAVYVMKPL
jgi:hypothetical protein